MKIKDIEREIESTEVAIIQFLNSEIDIASFESSYENWNRKDIVAHITEWIKFSSRKLASIKANTSTEKFDGLDKLNHQFYVNNKDKSIGNVLDNFSGAIQEYKRVLRLFSNEEILRKGYPIGFSFELWRYMLMDGVIHPYMHILYDYIKNKKNESFVELVKQVYACFMVYSNNDIKVYSFEEYGTDKKVEENFEELGRLYEDNILIKEIVNVNILRDS